VTLREVMPGDIVVVYEDGILVWLMLGEFMCSQRVRKNRGARASMALVDVIDHESLMYVPFSMRIVDADVEVVEVVERAARRRRLRKRFQHESGENVDPIAKWTHDARRQGEVF
jgi:hypothetical protein